MDINLLFEEWIKKVCKDEELKKYIHFDPPFLVSKRLSKIKREFLDITHIKRHNFYPFIKSKLINIKFKNKNGKRCIVKKPRGIAYAGHYDSLILSRYSYILQTHYELLVKKLLISDSIIAYRKIEKINLQTKIKKGCSNIDFALDIFNYIKVKGECIVLTFDVEKFFDTLDWAILKDKWKEVLNKDSLPEDHYHLFKILTNFRIIDKLDIVNKLNINTPTKKKLTKIYGYIHNQDIRKTINTIFGKNNLIKINKYKGIPQGSAISSVLSNIYMLDFDKNISALCNQNNALYRRYCDDIIIVCDLNMKQQFVDSVYKQIELLNLTIQNEKEDRTIFKFDDNQNLRGYYDMDDLKNINRNSKGKGLCVSKRKGDKGCILHGCDFEDKCKTITKKLQYLGFLFDGEEIEVRPGSMSNYRGKLLNAVRKTVSKARGKGSKSTKIFKKKLFDKYTRYGKRNFITYMSRAQIITGSKRIGKQYQNHIKEVNNLVVRYQNN